MEIDPDPERVTFFGPGSPRNTVTLFKNETPDGQGFIEGRRSYLYLEKEPKVPPGIHDNLQFGLQLFIGSPGQGQVAIINPDVVAVWQKQLTEATTASQLGQQAGARINIAALNKMGTVTIERGVHSCIIDQGVHPVALTGPCTHTQKIWTAKHQQLSFGVCRCDKGFPYTKI